MKFTHKKKPPLSDSLEYEKILQKFPKKPNYKYPSFKIKTKPTIDSPSIQNNEHLQEALFEWKRKRAMNNRSVKLCRNKKKKFIYENLSMCHYCYTLRETSNNYNFFTCDDIGLNCTIKQSVNLKFNQIDPNCIDLFIELNKQNYIDLYIS